MLELIGEGKTLLQRLVAVSVISQTEEFSRRWIEIAANHPAQSDFEMAIRGAVRYFNSLSDEQTSGFPKESEFVSVLSRSDVPLLRSFRAQMMLDGTSMVGSPDQILRLFETANMTDATFLKANFLFGDDPIDGYTEAQKITEAIRSLEEAAAAGFIQAIDYLATIHNVGDVVEMDERKATEMYQALAIYGDAGGQSSFGIQLMEGWGISRDSERGLEWINKGADNGSSEAIDYLFEYWVSRGNLKKAALASLRTAESGWVSYEDYGYVAAKLLIRSLVDSPEVLEKLDRYLRFHCESNIFVTEREECSKLSDTPRDFIAKFPLVEAVANPNKLRYVDEFSLPTGRYIALIVANDKYTSWDSLATPRQDAELIGTLLETNFGFEVTYLTNASRRETLKKLYDMAAEVEFNDHFLLYYAGHGVVDEATDTAYWIPSDASRDFRPDWISGDDIMTSLKAFGARHLLLVADSCYSGRLLRGAALAEGNPSTAVIQRLFSKKARVAITSGGDEPVEDASGGSDNSIFASALAKALRSIDSPKPASTVFNELLGQVSLEASQTPQYADMRQLDHDGGDFIFVPDS